MDFGDLGVTKMKIVHLCLGNFFPDNYSYQENMLPKFHKKMGHDVEVIASQETFNSSGNICYMNKVGSYINEYGIKVTRLAYRYPQKLNHKLKAYKGVYSAIYKSKPDILFIHNCQFISVLEVIKYLKKHANIRVFVDNHVDFMNSAKNWISKNILHKGLWKICAQSINPYVIKFYGVLPARVDFLKNVYKLPVEKCELLVMGADDDLVAEALKPEVRETLRKSYNVNQQDILMVTGGKIDKNKVQILYLMDAVNKLQIPNLRLNIFGSVIPELKEAFDSRLSERVKYIGWKKSDDIYREFAAADIVAFPGLHSVLWEQAVAMGKPCVFRRMEGFMHIDLMGNCKFFESDSVQEYMKVVTDCISSIEEMKRVAEQKGIEKFSYNSISKKMLEE